MEISELKGRVDFGIITIREDEYEAVLERFIPVGEAEGQRRYSISRVRTNDGDEYVVAAVRCPEQGTGEGQNVARDMIEDLDPQWLLVVGIGGAVPDFEFTLGDVVAAIRLLDFSIEAVIEDHPSEYAVGGGPMHRVVQDLLAHLPAMKSKLQGWNSEESIGRQRPPVDTRSKKIYGDQEWKKKVKESLLKHFGPQSTPRPPLVRVGSVASSDRLVKDSDLLRTWQQTARHINAVEMELAGVYKAARRKDREYPILAIRGISDIVGFKRDPDWTSYACHSAAAFALALIKTKPIKPKAAAPDKKSHSLADEFRYRTEQVLSKTRLAITGLRRVFERNEVDYIEDQLKLGKSVVLTGNAGTGKSGIGALIARAAIASGKTVLLLDARIVGHIKDEPSMRNFFSVDAPFSIAIGQLASDRGVRLIIDQLDNTIGLPAADLLIELALECGRHQQVEVVVLSRKQEAHEVRLLDQLTNSGFVELESHPLNADEAQQILEQLDIFPPSGDLIELSRNLLNLEIIATIKGKEPGFDFSNIYDELALWDGFIDTLQQREAANSNFQNAEQTLADAMDLAQKALNAEDQLFVLEAPLSQSYRRLESWGVIAKYDGQSYRFNHEKLQEYLYARRATGRGFMPSDVLGEINKLRSRNVLLWMDKIYVNRKSPRRVQFLKEMLNVQQ